MAATAGSGSDPVARFCAALRRLQESSGYEVPALARRLGISRSQLYAIVGGNIKRPPDWGRVVRPLVEACTAGDPHELARWRQDHAVLVRVHEELNRRARTRAGFPGGTGPGRQVVVGEIPREPPGFVRREALGELERAAGRRQVAVVCAVTGLRGVGKTQLAAAYARQRVADGWELVAWVNAENRDTLLAGLARVAGQLGVADPEGDSQESGRRLREYLTSRPGAALLVVDNATDPAALRPFLPAAGRTQVVVTSTDQAFSELGESVAVDAFSRGESLGYLASRTGLADDQGAGEVAAELGDLPIALAQAAATIGRRRLTYPGYLGLLRHVPVRDVLGVIRGGDYRYPAAAALLLSVQAAEADDPAGLTGPLLRVLAVLSPQGAGRDLLTGLATLGGDGHSVDDAVERCVAGSLLAWSVTGDAVIMHRLLGRVVRERDQADGRWPGTVSTALGLLEPRLFREQQAWDRRTEGAQLIAHIEALWEAATAADPGRPDLRRRHLQSRAWAVRQLRATADLTRAEDYAAQVMADCERLLGPGDALTLTSRYNLAEVWRSAGRMDRAISAHEQALAGRQRALGTGHPDTLASRDALASAYAEAGQTSRAISLHEQTLHDREQILGADHPDTLTSRDHLGEAHLEAWHHDHAIVLFQQALDGRERVLGPGHPDTLATRHNLASAYWRAGRSADAIALHKDILTAREHILGPDHPDTLASQSNLANAYRQAGRYTDAVALHERTLASRERVLGPDHPATLTSQNNLANAYGNAERYTDEVVLHEQTLASRERVLGPDHPHSLNSRMNLAVGYQEAGRIADAIKLNEDSVVRLERILGPDHPDTLAIRSNLADNYRLAGRHAEATALQELVLADCERTIGPGHPLTLLSRTSLATAYLDAGRVSESITVQERAVADYERVLGPGHPDTLTARRHLDTARHHAGDTT